MIYAVLVEDGLNEIELGRLLMSATFVTDMGTAIALPKIAPAFFRRYGDRVIEPEIKLVFVCLFVLMVLADASNGHAVLPAFILG